MYESFDATMYEAGIVSTSQPSCHAVMRALIRAGLGVQPATAYSTERGFSTRFEAFRISSPTTLPSMS